MIDLEDLQKINICNRCKVLYMPEFKMEEYTYEEFAINDKYCERCSLLTGRNRG